MYHWIIKKDDFEIGLATGKNKAIDRIKKELAFNGHLHLAKWTKINGNIACRVDDSTYIIERGNYV